MLTISNFQETTQANIGWGISAWFDASDDATSGNVTNGAIGGAGAAIAIWGGTKIGAEIGLAGGLVGVAIGAVVGGL